MTWLPTKIGKSAYQVAVDNGFVGTVEEWLLSLQGADGTQITISPTPPQNPQVNDLWINTSV